MNSTKADSIPIANPSTGRRRPTRRLAPLGAVLVAALSIGCGSEGDDDDTVVSSRDLATDEIEAQFTVTSSETGVVAARASFLHETLLGIDEVELGGGDSVRIFLNGESRRLDRSEPETDPVYTTTLETSPAAGEVGVRFRGTDLDVELDPEFEVTSPAGGAVFGFQDDLPLEWTPANPASVLQITLVTTCRLTAGGTRGGGDSVQVPDTGSFDYDLGLLPEATDPLIDTAEDCDLDLRFERTSSTDIAPPFETGSRLDSIQRRTVENVVVTF